MCTIRELNNFIMKKKSLFIVILICVIQFSGFSQDIIMLRTGDEIQSKVEEVGIDIIRYHKFDNISGPIYTIEKSKVFMIKYQNGSKDIFSEQKVAQTPTVVETPKTEIAPPIQSNNLTYQSNKNIFLNYKRLSPREVKSLMITYPDIQKEYKSGRTYNTIGACFMVPLFTSEFIAIFQIINKKDHISDMPLLNRKYGPTLAVMGVSFVGYVTFATIGSTKIMKSVSDYNNKVTPATSFNFNINPNGLGVVMKF